MANPQANDTIAAPHRRRFPRWWRRALLTSRRINLFLWLEAMVNQPATVDVSQVCWYDAS